jgi:deoxyadenosine/deoxycytidine kinase
MQQKLSDDIAVNISMLQERIFDRNRDIDLSFWSNGKKVAAELLENVGECPICYEACNDLMIGGKAGISIDAKCGHMICKLCWEKTGLPQER